MKKKGSMMLLGLLLALIAFQPTWAQKEKYHSIFIYNFSKYVKWPDSSNSGSFVIGVLGKSAIQKDLKAMAASKKVNGMPIEIKFFNSSSEIKDCHILYVAQSESNKMDEINAITQEQSILVVTDKPGLAEKGADINFIEVDGKIKFELNQHHVEARGMKVAGSLASLAIMV